MNRKYLILVVFTLICSSVFPQSYSIETSYWNCLVNTSQEFGLDLEKELRNYEDYLIENRVLVNSTGQSYYNLYQKMLTEGEINFDLNYSWIDTLKMHSNTSDIPAILPDCLDLIDGEDIANLYKNSKFYMLDSAIHSFEMKSSINVNDIVGAFCETLTPIDLEHNYYKMISLFGLASILEIDSGIPVKLPNVGSEGAGSEVGSRNILVVYATTDNDSVFVNNQKVLISELSDLVHKYIISDANDDLMPELELVNNEYLGEVYQSMLIVYLQNDRETLYQTYVNVHDQIVDAYDIARNEKANDYFELNYNELSTLQKKIINDIVPMRISEAEPK